MSETGGPRAEWDLTVRIWSDEVDGGYVAECLELPGCMSQGETEEEALANITDAIEEMAVAILRDSTQPIREESRSRGHRHKVKVAIAA